MEAASRNPHEWEIHVQSQASLALADTIHSLWVVAVSVHRWGCAACANTALKTLLHFPRIHGVLKRSMNQGVLAMSDVREESAWAPRPVVCLINNSVTPISLTSRRCLILAEGWPLLQTRLLQTFLWFLQLSLVIKHIIVRLGQMYRVTLTSPALAWVMPSDNDLCELSAC